MYSEEFGSQYPGPAFQLCPGGSGKTLLYIVYICMWALYVYVSAMVHTCKPEDNLQIFSVQHISILGVALRLPRPQAGFSPALFFCKLPPLPSLLAVLEFLPL